MSQSEMFEKGMTVRKQVLGAAHVERSMANADEHGLWLQNLVTEYCWGAVWGRDGIDHKWRSVLNLGMLTALNRRDELKLHIRGAVTNGLTKDEIYEILLQTAIYCGVPAALDAFRSAKEVFAELEKK